jgi:hypothetical protein
MKKTMVLAGCVCLALCAQDGWAKSTIDYQHVLRLQRVKGAGSTMLGLGVAGTTVGVGLLIAGNVIRNRNSPGYYSSVDEEEDAKRAFRTGTGYVTAAGYCYGIGLPMIIGGAIVRGVSRRKLKRISGGNYSITIRRNTLALTRTF